MSENLPATSNDAILEQAKQHRRPAQRGGAFLKFNGNTGEWLLGKDEEHVDNCVALINSKMMMHGYAVTCKPIETVFTLDWEAYPNPPESRMGKDFDGNEQMFHPVEARQVAGRFKDEELGTFMFSHWSMGCVEAMDKMFDAIYTRMAESKEFFYPEVLLEVDSYKHPTRGNKIFTPVLTIQKWCNVDGEAEEEVGKLGTSDEAASEAAESDEDAPPPPRRRRRAA
jgi:hypothetical protein